MLVRYPTGVRVLILALVAEGHGEVYQPSTTASGSTGSSPYLDVFSGSNGFLLRERLPELLSPFLH